MMPPVETEPIVRLDDLTHRAWIGGREVVRVTTALADAGLVDAQYFTEGARARGRYLHDAIALHHAHRLDETTLDPYMRPFWDGYLAFRDESEFTVLSVEQPIADDVYGYAGRYDLFGFFSQLPTATFDLIDVKTGRAPREVELQTMGYRRRVTLSDGTMPARVRRWCLELPGDSRYRLLPLNLVPRLEGFTIDRERDRRHEHVFLAAVTIANWKRGLIR